MFSVFLYGLSIVLVIYIIFSIYKSRGLKIDNAIAILVFIGSVIIAQRVPPPAWLPFASQGKLVLSEDFDDGLMNGMEPSGLKVAIVSIDKTDMALEVINNSETDWNHIALPKQSLADGTIEYRINMTNYNTEIGASGAIALHFRSTPEDRRYLLATAPINQSLSLNYQGFDTNDGWEPLTESTPVYNLNPNIWHKIKLVVSRSSMTVYLNDVKVLSATDDRNDSGEIYFGIGPQTSFLLDDFFIWKKR